MEGVSTMNLTDHSDSMTPLFGGGGSPPPSSVPFSQAQSGPMAFVPFGTPAVTPPTPNFAAPAGGFAAPPVEKNMGALQMDSTPIAEIMSQDVEYAQAQGPYMTPQPPAQQQQAPAKKGPMGLTPEQMEALLAGLVAVVAFSTPVQERLIGFLPQMVDTAGDRSNIGLLVTALVAALIFYFGRRFVVK